MSVFDKYSCEGQLSIEDVFGQDIWSGRTCQGPSVQTVEKISRLSSRKRQKSQTKMPLFLDLRGAGHLVDVSWETDGLSLGEYMMPNTGEFHSEENAYVYSLISMGTAPERYCLNCGEKPSWEIPSKLSQILEHHPDPKYNLSQKACLGILRRAERRGKVLPEMLKAALERQAGLSVSKNEQANQGGGKGILIQNERTGALSTLNNQSVCCLNDQGGSQMSVSDDVSGTLRAQEHGHQPVVYGISAYESNAMKSANPNSGIYEAETSRTLDLNGGSPACNQGGMAVVCLEGNGARESHRGNGFVESEVMYTLNTVEQHAVAYRGDAITNPINASNPKPGDPCHTLVDDGRNYVVLENHPADSRVKVSEDGVVQTLSGRMGTGGGNVPMVFSEVAAARCAQDGRGTVHTQMMSDPESNFVLEPYTSSKASYHQHFTNDGKAETLVASDYKDPPTVTYGLDRASFNQGQNAQFDFSVEEEKVGSLTARGPGGVLPCASVDCLNGRGTGVNGTLAANARKSLNSGNVVRCESVVRRLTPLECTRLQGFPDGWVDIGEWVDSNGKVRKDSDAPKYKALGNSIALPFWRWLAERIRKHYVDYIPTMASLFDGIGGFPLSFSEVGIEPVWASEIEDFPIAVTKIRFPDAE